MQRFFGKMPASEVAISKKFVDRPGPNGLSFRIEAGNKGWTILFADLSTEYEDVEATAEQNFEKAKAVAKEIFPEMYEFDAQTAIIGEDFKL